MIRSTLTATLIVLAGAMAQANAQGSNDAAPAAASPLPGGASSLQESYDDWRVVCGVGADNTKQCVMQQTQTDSKSGQRILAVELKPVAGGVVEGNLLMPFGLGFDAGVSLALDDGAKGKPLMFKTCLPAGCVVPVTLDAATVKAFRAGKQLKLATKTADTPEKDALFAVSLKGFGPAFDRTSALLK